MDNLGITGQLILHDFLIALGLFSAGWAVLCFWKAIFQKRKRCKLYSWACTIIFAAICVIFWYGMHRNTGIVRMDEDVLYIHPRSENHTVVYDGTKNDPNVKEDTTKY